MISSEDVIGLSECIPGLLGGVAPAHILEIDLPPQRQTLVPGSPVASPGPGVRQRGEMMGEDVSINLCFIYQPQQVCLLVVTVWSWVSRCVIRHMVTSPTVNHPENNKPCSPTTEAKCDLTHRETCAESAMFLQEPRADKPNSSSREDLSYFCFWDCETRGIYLVTSS